MTNVYKCLLASLMLILHFTCFSQSTQLQVDTHNGFINRENNYLGTTFTRSIDVFNVDNGSFTGYIKIKENSGTSLGIKMKIKSLLPNSSPAASVALVDVSPANSNANDVILPNGNPVGLQMVPAQDNEIIIRVQNFKQNLHKLLITEDVVVTSCLSANNTSSLSVFFVSTTSATPPLATDYQMIQGATYSQIISKGDAPLHRVFDYEDDYNKGGWSTPGIPLFKKQDFYCTGDNNFKTLKFSMGLSDEIKYAGATFHDLKLYFNNDNVLFSVDRHSIVIEKRKVSDQSLIKTWTMADQYDVVPRAKDATSANCLSDDRKFDNLKYSLDDIKSDEYLVIIYDMYNCCKKADLFDGSIMQHNQVLTYSFVDDCGVLITNSGELQLGPNTGYYNRGIEIRADVNSSPAQLLGPNSSKSYPDLGNYVIDNPLNSNLYTYWPTYGGVEAVYNLLQAQLVVRVKSGSSLRYITNTSQGVVGTYDFAHNSTLGNFSYYPAIGFIDKANSSKRWTPVSNLGTVVSTSPAGYETREFLFDLTSMPGVTANISDYDRLMLLYYNMNSMQLTFSMEGVCSAEDDGNWEVQYLFNTDKTCSQCLLPVSKVSDITVVNCPGCKVPGAAAHGNVERTFYGPFDVDNNSIPDEAETTVNTLSTVKAYNSQDSDPTNDVQTNMASVGDDMTFSGGFYLTAPSDCNAANGGRVSCRDYELQYQWAYLQVKVPQGYFDNNIRNLQVKFKAAGATSYVAINPHTVTFYNAPSKDIFYIKVNVAATGNPYFSSKDAFDIVFNSKIIKNPAQRERHEIQFMAYFTKAEELISVLEVAHPDLYNRSYADCSTPEVRGTTVNCNTETLQMICETWGSYLNLINVVTRINDASYTGYTQAKVCIPYAKSNGTGYYGGEKSNFGNTADYYGINLYKNEFRKAPVIQYIHVVVPEGYYFNSLDIGTQSGAGQDVLSIKGSTLTGTNQTKNNMINVGRVLDFDVRNLSSLADGTSNPAKPLHYTDESSTHDFFNITLLADCRYLAQHGIVQTDMGNVTVGNQKVYSTVQYDNTYVGNNGSFLIGGDNVFTRSPLLSSTPPPFEVVKKNAEDKRFKLQKKTDFVNEFDFKQNYDPSTNYVNNYFGRMFIGVDPAAIKTMFSDFKVEVSGVELIHINSTLNLNTSFGFFDSYVSPYAPVPVKVSGKINIASIANCADTKKVIYDLIYGIHCNESQVNAQSILGTTMCNKWKENIELEIDEVDLLLTSDVNPTYPIISGAKATHQAVFTATRSQVNQLDVQLASTLAANTAIQSVAYIKNTGSSSTSVQLVEGTNYTLSSDKKTLSVFKFPDGTYFESITENEDYYNEIEIIYDLENTTCNAADIKTTLTGIGTPFYSATQCKTTRSLEVQSQLVANAPIVKLVGADHVCPESSGTLTAQLSGLITTNVTYTWYKVVNGTRQLLRGPDNINTYTHYNLTETTTFEVVVNSSNSTCTSSDELTVILYELPVIQIIAPVEFCIGSAAAKLTGLPAGGYFSGQGVTLTPSGVYTFSATAPGSYDIYYNYPDPTTGCTAYKKHTIVVSACCKYALATTEVLCGEDVTKCITLKAVKPVDDGIKGMDFVLRYDRTIMRPTGIPGRGNATLGNVVLNSGMTSSMGSYAMTERTITGTNFNELSVSIFYSSQAPATADFDGVGDVICIEFKISGSATSGLGGTTIKPIAIGDFYQGGFSKGVVDDEHKVFMIRSCVENNGDGSLSILKNNFLNGKVYYHNDANAPLRYDAATTPRPYLETTITPVTTAYGSTVCNPSAVATKTTDLNGSYSIDLTGANGVKVDRDIVGDYYNSCTNPSDVINPGGNVYNPASLLVAINGYDAYLMESITTMRAPADVVYVADRKVPTATNSLTATSLFPTPFQMIASDVNMDRTVRAVDITLVQERAVSKLCEYPQVWNYNLGVDPTVYPANSSDQHSLDWRFVDKSQVLTNLAYQRSNKYPLPAGTTGTSAGYYWRDNVPSPPRCLMGPAVNPNTCKSYANSFDIHAIMLGDIDGSWRANMNGSQKNLREESDGRKVVVKAGNKQQIGLNTYRIPVTFVSMDAATVSLDFALDYKEDELKIQKVGSYEAADAVNAQVVYNDLDYKQLLFTSYTMSQLPTATPVYYLDVVTKNGSFDANMLGGGDAYLNGQKVELIVEGSTVTGIDNPLGSQYGFELIPNPTAHEGEIVYHLKSGAKAKIVVYNTLGQVITEYTNLEGQGNIQVATSDWSSGMYQVILFTENSQKLIKKWVIQN